MSDISVLGLGLMGGALARALQKGNHQITVWNRTAEKMEPFERDGAVGASNVVSAVTASTVILVCVDNYTVAESFLCTDAVAPHLSGRTLIQLSTGTPREAREASAWFNDHGVTYIDGAILALPADIGTKNAQILFAGPEVAFKQVEPLLTCLGGDLRYLGENVRAPATLDLAFLSQRFGQILGAIHGIRLCESEDVDADLFATLFAEGERPRILARVVGEDGYDTPNVTVRVWDVVLQRIQKQAVDAKINKEFPEFAYGIVKRAITTGYVEEDVAALIKVLRDN